MTQIPAGWFPDPEPGQTHRLRYWDGQLWTEHTHPMAPGYAGPGGQVAKTTPDGAPLAGWWMRVGASLIDSLILGPLGLLLGFPFLLQYLRAYTAYVDQMTAARQRGDVVDPTSFLADAWLPLIGVAVVATIVGLVYHGGFLRWKNATPGKLAVGLRVRLREKPGQLPWSAIAKRLLVYYGSSLLSVIPVLGLVSLLNVLWPLWDDTNQALHDKAARTNVVVHRR